MTLRSVTLIGWLGMSGWLVAGCGAPSAPPASSPDAASTADSDGIPVFELDQSWPKRPFPNQWVFGNVAGMAMDANDHLWVIHRPLSVTLSNDYAALDPPAGECCRPFPAIIEFDPSGEVVQAWGGPDPAAPESKRTAGGYDWPREHGLFVDHDGNVWTGGAEPGAATVTKLTGDGQLLFQKGGVRSERGQRRYGELRITGGYLRRCGRQRGLCRGWVREQPRDRTRRGHGSVQTDVGRVRQRAD